MIYRLYIGIYICIDMYIVCTYKYISIYNIKAYNTHYSDTTFRYRHIAGWFVWNRVPHRDHVPKFLQGQRPDVAASDANLARGDVEVTQEKTQRRGPEIATKTQHELDMKIHEHEYV